MPRSENTRRSENTSDIARINQLQQQLDDPNASPEERARRRTEYDALQTRRNNTTNSTADSKPPSSRGEMLLQEVRGMISGLVNNSGVGTGAINPSEEAERAMRKIRICIQIVGKLIEVEDALASEGKDPGSVNEMKASVVEVMKTAEGSLHGWEESYKNDRRQGENPAKPAV